MQIDFNSSSGVAGQDLTYQVDTNALTQQQARELESLVESSRVFELRVEDLNPNITIGRTDVISYHLILSDDTRHVDLWLNDLNAPASIRPLLERLRKLALAQKRS